MAHDAGRPTVDADRAQERKTLSILVVAVSIALVAMMLPSRAASATSSSAMAVLIPGQGVYLGAFSGPLGVETRQQALTRVESEIGRPFAIDHEYYKWDTAFPTSQESWAVGQGSIPFMNWKAQRQDGTPVAWSAIANGSQDAWIVQRADAIKAFGSPMYLAFHHEPEDDLATWGTPSDYAAAFRHIVEVFRSRGVTNVAFVWTMMNWTFDPRSGRDPNAYYPGDGYVDIVGVDGYSWYPGRAGSPWESFQQIFQNSNDFAALHSKPWMAVETGVQEDPLQPGRKGQWFRDIVATAESWPLLKGVIYFDINKDCDWRSDTSVSSEQGFAALGADPYFNPVPSTPSPPPSSSPSPSVAPSPSTSPAPSSSPSPSPVPTASTTATPPPSASPTSSPIPSLSPGPSPGPSTSPTSSPSASPAPTVPPPPTPSPSQGPTFTWPLTDPLDAGIPGQAVMPLDQGGVSAFDSVVTQGNASLVYDDALTRVVGLSALHRVGANGSAYYGWHQSFGAQRLWFGRVYVRFDALPGGSLRLVEGLRSGRFLLSIDVLPSGRLAIEDRLHRRVASTARSIRTGGWVRIEWRVDQTKRQMEVRFSNRPRMKGLTDSAVSSGRFGHVTDEVEIGRVGGGSFPSVFWTDDPGVRLFRYFGP